MFIDATRNHVRPPLGEPLEFGHSPSARRTMFIDARWNQGRPPSGGPCQSVKAKRVLNNMPLLTEGGRVASRVL